MNCCDSPPNKCYNMCKACKHKAKTRIQSIEETMTPDNVKTLVTLVLNRLDTVTEVDDLDAVATEVASSIQIQSQASMQPDRQWTTNLVVKIGDEVTVIPAGTL